MYNPEEDSFLLEKEVLKFAQGKVLDIGTGTGIQAVAAAKREKVSSVLAVDVDEESIDYCKKNVINKKITFRISNLFSAVKGKFDTIIFNPPYLPHDNEIKDKAIYGGKKGYELIEKFFNKVGNYLNKEGIILTVFSSLTGKNKIDEIIRKKGFHFELLVMKHLFFEDLYVYLVRKI